MTKAKLIKRDEIVERQQLNATQRIPKQKARKTMEVVSDWIEASRKERIDPRAAFAALFAQPQAR